MNGGVQEADQEVEQEKERSFVRCTSDHQPPRLLLHHRPALELWILKGGKKCGFHFDDHTFGKTVPQSLRLSGDILNPGSGWPAYWSHNIGFQN